MRKLCLILLLFSTGLFAQRHVRGLHPRHEKVMRMDEALLDTTHTIVAADDAWSGFRLPQAFTGQGVMIGITDIGFDFTHPHYEHTRFVSFWDMLSRDTLNSHNEVFTGRDYLPHEMHELQHSFDGCDHTHGTMIMGTAVGNDLVFRGMAPEADVVVVNGILSNNSNLVDSLQRPKLERNYKFDEFAYIFEQATRRGQPCVINMSAGSRQSFGDEFDIYNKKVDELTGPGRIIVAAAGNNGTQLTTLHKPATRPRVGSLLSWNSTPAFYLFFQKEGTAECRLQFTTKDEASLQDLPDSIYERIDTISDYDAKPVEYLYFEKRRLETLGIHQLFVSLCGQGEAYLFTQDILFDNSKEDNDFADAECTYGVNFPAAYDNVICVANTVHRSSIINYLGEHRTWWDSEGLGEEGRWCRYSSTGPRLDGYQKPDISAPGCYITSSVSSFCEEKHPNDPAISDDRARFTAHGRTYAWRADSGTSLSSPIVAGIIALWLQANPTLTPQDIKGVLRRTARHPDPTLSYPNALYGYGEIDAYAGLLDIVGASGIEGVSHTQPQGVTFALQGRDLLLHFDRPTTDIHIYIYNTSGQQVYTTFLPQAEGDVHLALPSLPRGVYVVQLNSRQERGSTLIRI